MLNNGSGFHQQVPEPARVFQKEAAGPGISTIGVKKDEYLLVEGFHEAIIDHETWEAVRVRRKVTGVNWKEC